MTETHEADGVLIVNKHAGVTSHDIVNRVRRLYGTKKVGHTGTLDPMATGVLVVLIGRAAKASEYLRCDRKRYLATLRLGLTTDTEDTTGTVLTTCDRIPDFDALCAVLPEFRGTIPQIPPMYSALKVGGQKLVDLARRGITVERQAREIEIVALTAAPTDRPSDFLLDVTCSGGTYIRTLCADIGARARLRRRDGVTLPQRGRRFYARAGTHAGRTGADAGGGADGTADSDRAAVRRAPGSLPR